MTNSAWLSGRHIFWIVLCASFLVVCLFYLPVFRLKNEETNIPNVQRPSCKYSLAKDEDLQIHLLSSKSSLKYNNSRSIIVGTGMYRLKNPKGTSKVKLSWSQYGQDRYLDELLNQKRNGYFVEIGGYDGESFSNTLFFEKRRGWTGLLVEANPYVFKIMVDKDRKCYMMNACISNSSPCMSFVLAGAITSAKETLTDRHRNRINKEDKIYGGKDSTWVHSTETVDVRCYPLTSIMKALNRTRIDYFSLDVEGAEMYILESIDWNKLDIDVFTIETDQHRNQILTFMKRRGYKWINKLSGDDIFRKIR